VAPCLAGYQTLDAPLQPYYGSVLSRAVERTCHLPDGRILDYGTVEDACFWLRWQAIRAQGSDQDTGDR
jgi:hypothetical protein